MEQTNQKKIKLFFCINDLQKGGAEKQLNYISDYLSNYYDVYIFTLGYKKVEYKFDKKIIIYHMNKKFFFFQFFIKILTIKPKVIFYLLPKAYFFFGSVSILFPKIKKILLRRSLNYYHKNLIYKYFEIFLHRFTHTFICNSFAAKKNLIRHEYVSHKKVKVISNYIEFSKKKVKVKKNNYFNILCISNFHKYKGHFLLLKSISYLKDFPIKLYLYGNDKDISKKDLIRYSKKLNIYKKVNFINKISTNLTFPYISLGVLFSQTESFPNAILEYYTFKLPILAYDTGDIKKLVNQKNGKVFKSRDPKVISRIIKNLYLDKNLKMKSHNSYLNLEKYSNKEKNLLHFSKIINKSLCVE